MQPKKEHYRRKLPHYQQPGQWYSVTFTLKGAMPKGAMAKYATALETARTRYRLLLQESGFPNPDTSRLQVRKPAVPRESGFPKPDVKDTDFPKSVKGFSTKQFPAKELSGLGNPESHLVATKKEYQIALRKYRLAYDKFLNKSALPGTNLVKDENRKIIEEALLFWEGKRLTSHAWCIMPNHVHWVLTVFEREFCGLGNPQSRESGFPNPDAKDSDFPKSENELCGLGNPQSQPQSRDTDFPKSVKEISGLGNPESHVKPVYLQDILHSVKLFTARRINKNENRSGHLWEEESFETTIRNDRHFVNVYNYVIQNPVSAGFVKNWQDWPGTRTFPSP
jgi:REP element-mobilizing transposase RayT